MAKQRNRAKGPKSDGPSGGRRGDSEGAPAPPPPEDKPKTASAPLVEVKSPLSGGSGRTADLPIAALGFCTMGVIAGAVTGFANWGMTFLAGTTGVVVGLALGATVAHSLLLSGRVQGAVLVLCAVLCLALSTAFGPAHAPLGLVLGSGASLGISILLHRFVPRAR